MIEPLDPKNTVLLVALEKELPKRLIPTWNIYYTGVGKVNAALSVVAAFNLYKPNVIINYGTVGSLNPKLQSDVDDMESYSIAKFCFINKIKFICYKYITDNADENSPENWNLNIEKGAELFTKTLNDLI